jgi:hypothetical protein
MDQAEWTREIGIDYASAVQAARDIVRESITRLDSVNLPGTVDCKHS